MATHHNLGTVISFEFLRTVKKKSFWVATLAFPVMIAVVFGIVYYSGKTSDANNSKLAKEKFSIEYIDESGVILPPIASAFKAEKVTNRDEAIKRVQQGKLDAFFYYPKNTPKQHLEIYGKDVGLFNNGKYSAVAQQMLTVSATTRIGSSQLVDIARGNVPVNTTTYTSDGHEAAGWNGAIPPLVFLVFFYFTVVMLGSNLLNSTVEEKENRVTEMILTTLNPTTLIVGKIVATFMAGLVQAVVIAVPIVAAYILLGSDAAKANLPDLSMLNSLIFNPTTLMLGALIFVGGMMLFTGTLVAVGAIMPTAKEAGQYFGISIAMMFVPFYILPVILSDSSSIVVQAFTFFPYTAPITSLLRNAFGSLSPVAAGIVIVELWLLGIFIIGLAVRLFRYGAMEYSGRLSIKTIWK